MSDTPNKSPSKRKTINLDDFKSQSGILDEYQTSSRRLTSSHSLISQSSQMTETLKSGLTAGIHIGEDPRKKTKTLFEEFLTKSGLEYAIKGFEENSVEKEMTEAEFVPFFCKLVNFSDWEIYQIFDILDNREVGAIGWDEYYIMLALYSAYYSKKLTKFLYKYGNILYNHFCNPLSKKLTFERFSTLGFMLGLGEDEILNTLKCLNVKKGHIEMIGLDDFVLYYFAIFNAIDTGVNVLKDDQDLSYSFPYLVNRHERPSKIGYNDERDIQDSSKNQQNYRLRK